MKNENDLVYRIHYGVNNSDSYDSDGENSDESAEGKPPPMIIDPSRIVRIVNRSNNELESSTNREQQSVYLSGSDDHSSTTTYFSSSRLDSFNSLYESALSLRPTSDISPVLDVSNLDEHLPVCPTCGQSLPTVAYTAIPDSTVENIVHSNAVAPLATLDVVGNLASAEDFGISSRLFSQKPYTLEHVQTNADVITISKVPQYNSVISFINKKNAKYSLVEDIFGNGQTATQKTRRIFLSLVDLKETILPFKEVPSLVNEIPSFSIRDVRTYDIKETPLFSQEAFPPLLPTQIPVNFEINQRKSWASVAKVEPNCQSSLSKNVSSISKEAQAVLSNSKTKKSTNRKHKNLPVTEDLSKTKPSRARKRRKQAISKMHPTSNTIIVKNELLPIPISVNLETNRKKSCASVPKAESNNQPELSKSAVNISKNALEVLSNAKNKEFQENNKKKDSNDGLCKFSETDDLSKKLETSKTITVEKDVRVKLELDLPKTKKHQAKKENFAVKNDTKEQKTISKKQKRDLTVCIEDSVSVGKQSTSIGGEIGIGKKNTKLKQKTEMAAPCLKTVKNGDGGSKVGISTKKPAGTTETLKSTVAKTNSNKSTTIKVSVNEDDGNKLVTPSNGQAVRNKKKRSKKTAKANLDTDLMVEILNNFKTPSIDLLSYLVDPLLEPDVTTDVKTKAYLKAMTKENVTEEVSVGKRGKKSKKKPETSKRGNLLTEIRNTGREQEAKNITHLETVTSGKLSLRSTITSEVTAGTIAGICLNNDDLYKSETDEDYLSSSGSSTYSLDFFAPFFYDKTTRSSRNHRKRPKDKTGETIVARSIDIPSNTIHHDFCKQPEVGKTSSSGTKISSDIVDVSVPWTVVKKRRQTPVRSSQNSSDSEFMASLIRKNNEFLRSLYYKGEGVDDDSTDSDLTICSDVSSEKTSNPKVRRKESKLQF